MSTIVSKLTTDHLDDWDEYAFKRQASIYHDSRWPYRNRPLSEQDKSANRYKSKVRARVEHIFGVMKRQFGYKKARYRGLDKNAHSVFTKCALINLVIAKRSLMATLVG